MPTALTKVTVTGTVQTEYGTPATGYVTAQLSAAISNGASPVFGVDAITIYFDSTGSFSLPLVANDDTDVTPTGTVWNFTIAITGQVPAWTFSVVIPHSSAPAVDLFTIAPVTNSQVKYAYVTGVNANGIAALTGSVEFEDSTSVTWDSSSGKMVATLGASAGVASVRANSGTPITGAVEFADSTSVTWSEVSGHMEATAAGGGTPGAPAFALGTVNTQGISSDFAPVDSTILAFDATAPVTQAFADLAATGSATVTARRDHKHGMPAAPTASSVGALASASTLHGIAAANANDGDVTVSSHKITNLTNGSLAQDAAAFGQIPVVATTVTGPDAFGAVAVAGTGTKWAPDDHDHGLPANPVTAAAVEALMAAKGNLIVGTGAGAGAQLAVGANTQVLTADSTQASGMKWAAGGGVGTVETKSASYTMLATDALVIASGAPTTITLPDATAVTPGQLYAVKRNQASNTAGTAITTGTAPLGIAITPDGTTAYVCNSGSNTVTPITIATNTAGTAITVGTNPYGIAITPDGTTAYVTNYASNTVTPITIATNTAGTAITVGTQPWGIAITPDGATAYVCNYGGTTVTPITIATNTAGTAITVGTKPLGIAITPDGATAYVTNYSSNTVTPITIATNTAGTAITVGTNPAGIAITLDGTTAYVCNSASSYVAPITIATNTAGTAITVGAGPYGIAITPDGTTAYVCNYGNNNFIPITIATNTAGTAITVGANPISIAITPDGTTAYVCNSGGTTVTPIHTGTICVAAKSSQKIDNGAFAWLGENLEALSSASDGTNWWIVSRA